MMFVVRIDPSYDTKHPRTDVIGPFKDQAALDAFFDRVGVDFDVPLDGGYVYVEVVAEDTATDPAAWLKDWEGEDSEALHWYSRLLEQREP